MEIRSEYHNPVLLNESVGGLISDINGIYVDVTFGGGGHSREVLSRLGENGKLISFDQDEDAAANAQIQDERFFFVQSNFRYLKNHLRFSGFNQVDGVLADLGVSSHQFDEGERGFSIRQDGPLDMRMGKTVSLTAQQVVNDYEIDQLKAVFRDYGELREAGRIARVIEAARSESPITRTGELIKVVEKLTSPHKLNRFLAQVFQALRIEVNGEMKVLEDMLLQTADVIKPGGKLVVISYHSLEDRLVKRFMRDGNFSGEVEQDFFGNKIRPFTPDKGMPIVPSEKEIEENNRARSAKLRIATRNE